MILSSAVSYADCRFSPEDELISWWEKIKLLKGLIGLLFGGIATPVEAAGIDSYGLLIVAITQRRSPCSY